MNPSVLIPKPDTEILVQRAVELISKKIQLNSQVKLVDLCTSCAQDLGISFHVGWIASQDLFMSRTEDLDRLMSHFPQSACSEMEAGAIAQVAHSFQVPYVIVRALSDVAVHHDNPMEFSEYAPKASAQSAQLVETFIKRL